MELLTKLKLSDLLIRSLLYSNYCFNIFIILSIIVYILFITPLPLIVRTFEAKDAPDVYDDVPTIVTTWLTIMPKISILVFCIELQSGISLNTVSLSLLLGYSSKYVFKNLLLISSLLSLIIGTVVGLAQTRIKRLLAYSTISHVGFLLLALAINTEQSIDSLIFYLIQYSFTNLNTFFILLAFGYLINSTIITREKETNDIQYISELKGQFYSNPLLSLSLAICLFSMAGT